jgi:hypothetical protein
MRIESYCGQSPEVGHQDIRADSTRRKEETETWVSRWSDRQSSVGTRVELVWRAIGRSGDRNFPPNIRVIGDSTKLAYSCLHSLSMKISVQRDGIIDTPRSLDFPPQSGLTETPRVGPQWG